MSDATMGISSLDRVLQQFDLGSRPLDITPLGDAGGFSGARFWRIESALGPMCLRCWPSEHPSPERLRYIHSVLLHVVRDGLTFIPAPRCDRQGRSFVEEGGQLWELTPWLPGVADFHQQPSPSRLQAAVHALARFHGAAEKLTVRTLDVPPYASERLDSVRSLLSGGLAQIDRHVCHADWPNLEPIARRVLQEFAHAAPRVLSRLETVSETHLPVHPCIRDIWHDHVLFHQDQVTGIVDFGALRVDHAAVDIARLLGSLVADDRKSWRYGLSAYQQIRELSRRDLLLIEVADESNILLSGMNWLRWIYVEHRQFTAHPVILQRLEGILARMQRLVGQRDLRGTGFN